MTSESAGRKVDGDYAARRTYVPVMKPTDLGHGDDAAVLGWLRRARLGCIFVQGKMRPRAVVVVEITAQTTTQVSFVEDDDVVEARAGWCRSRARRTGSATESVLP